ncbi:subfamily RNA polymerase sigma-70 subunit [Synechococcus phage ACG-2014f]|uniref:Subfamily RNA polymerase sigma-70 subunit n=2 Tax=Atlauavirus tusconc8 TaxID=2734085 RepID=A0A0E3HH92_9CAUD|nr:RNA polymerase sigma factor [Synechococcus phage ACG-2014f_Syn7803C8]AIX29583.1 subfamily RNA polymerase sigma-70 subunit [Synechococcus phage ACG-2014f]AIX21514.1 subfamily RNA polymerase sigma-70 subunit [Synechococcus phage ACG-2014f_Syn7803C8]AIX31533.1 subfamily RNA polymerase sigma-70 subunit [Synechococcus phage ACG-2014f]AIX31819.1 subfamily RNA polymerase sigma-70 subunit [Synechococcus phage ACG-2014f]AIX33174.1 subfamily RNA polymerase sigma-70 subunit [Synechococcus phage ACG-20
MQKKNRISHEEEIKLCRQAQLHDHTSKYAMTKMVNANIGLVEKIANKLYIKNDQYSFDDLYQEGVFGLIRGVNKFDPSVGCRFSTYSYYWIYSYIMRYCENNLGKIRIPTHLREKMRKQKDNKVELDRLKSKVPSVVSLNTLVGESLSLDNVVTYTENISFDDEMEHVLVVMNEVLDEREHQVLCSRFGIGGEKPLSQRECAKLHNVTHGAIYLIEKKSIKKIKHHMGYK